MYVHIFPLLNATAVMVMVMMVSRKAIFDGFVMQYAAAEDDIRGLWERLLVAHRKFLVRAHVRVFYALHTRIHSHTRIHLFIY